MTGQSRSVTSQAPGRRVNQPANPNQPPGSGIVDSVTSIRAADIPPAEQNQLVRDALDSASYDQPTPDGQVPDVPDPDDD